MKGQIYRRRPRDNRIIYAVFACFANDARRCDDTTDFGGPRSRRVAECRVAITIILKVQWHVAAAYYGFIESKWKRNFPAIVNQLSMSATIVTVSRIHFRKKKKKKYREMNVGQNVDSLAGNWKICHSYRYNY